MSSLTHRLSVAGLVIGVLLLAAGVLRWISPPPEPSDAPLWGSLIAQGLWILLALVGAVASRSQSLTGRLGLGPGTLTPAVSIVVVLGFIALSDGLHLGLVSVELRDTGALGEIDAVVREARTRAPSFLLALLALGVAPGFGEEILFRGFLQRGLSARLGPRWGVALAAALFALAHFDPIHSSVAFVLGVYLGVVTQLAGSIRTAILCHVLNNTLGLLAPILSQDLPFTSSHWAIPALVAAGPAALLYAAWRGRAGPPRHA